MSKKSKQLANKSISYTATTTYTFEEFKRFSKHISKKRLRKCDIIVIATYLVIAGLSLWQQNYQAIFIYLAIIPVFLAFSRIFLNLGLKRIWKSNKDADGLKTTFTFRLSDFRQKNKLNDVTTNYGQLTEIVETETNFYLMVSENRGSLLNKKDCSEELIEFLRQRAAEINPSK